MEEISRKEITPFGGDYIDSEGATVIVDGWCLEMPPAHHEVLYEDEFDSDEDHWDVM